MSDEHRDAVANAMSALYDLIYLTESGHFYEDHDNSSEVLGRAKAAYESLREEIDFLRDQWDQAALRYIEASNPGIDMEEVKRFRSSRASEPVSDTTGMCPHCGEIVKVVGGLTIYHDWPKPTRQLCPGSKQNPRNPESDGRPLWNGESNPHFYRNQPEAADG